MDLLQIETKRLSKDVMKITISGSLNAMTFEKLDDVLRTTLYDGIPCILLDLGAVTQISSAGAGVLVATKETAQKAGGGMVLLHIPERISEVLHMLGLMGADADSSLLPAAASEEEGLALLATLRSRLPS